MLNLYLFHMRLRKIRNFFQGIFNPNPRCYICKRRHKRKKGWMHIEIPLCDACDAELCAEVDNLRKAGKLD